MAKPFNNNKFTMADSSQESKWYVLQVRPRSEKKVEQQLIDLGFEACVPIQQQVRRWSDRKKVVDMVLFNNYVFVSSTPDQRKDTFQLGSNVIKYVSFGKEIATLSKQDIQLVKKLAQLSTPVQITYHSLQLGDLVEVQSGCLIGRQGHIVALNGGDKLQLAIPNLQCFAQVEVKGVEVKRVNSIP